MAEPSRAMLAAIAAPATRREDEEAELFELCQEMQEALDEMHAWSRKKAGMSFEEEKQVLDEFGEVCAAPLEIADELRDIPARTMVGLRAKAAALLASETYLEWGKECGPWGPDDSVYAALTSIVRDIENLLPPAGSRVAGGARPGTSGRETLGPRVAFP